MGDRRLPGTALRVRRGRRRDLAQLRAVIGAPPGARLERFLRRILADLGMDVYVAEDDGRIVGVVAVAYRRSLMRGGLSAVLDGVRAGPAPPGVLDGLLAFAEERARRRGCRRLAACVDAADPALRAALRARGYRAEELFVTDLAGAA